MPPVEELLAAALVAAVALLVPATVAVFTVRPTRSTSPPSRVLASAGAVAAAIPAGAWLVGSRPLTGVLVGLLLAGSVLAWAPVARPWAVRGLLVWALSVDAGLLYLGYVLHWTVTAHLSWASLLASGVLWVLEVFVFVLALGYVWEFVDALGRRSWPRARETVTRPSRSGRFVSLHVPAHNEPPDMVIATLRRLLALEYDEFEILMVDNNTVDESLWRPVQEFCAGHDRIRFVHLENWPGYKSGALNYALSVTDPRAEVVGIVDADYLVEPDFLARCAALFDDDRVGFVQTPQDYRDWEQSAYFRRLYHSYNYFFEVSQRSRNERNGAIFGGTMGLIRRSALAEVGGWDEWCITEDAELSLRLLRAGWVGHHIERSFGRGIMPLTFEALKRQRFRWCFGGVQILRMHWRSLLPWGGPPDNRLSLSQRWAYLVGGLQWFGDLAGLLFTGFLLAGALDLVLGDGTVIRRVSGFVLVCVVGLVMLGAVRSVALVRRAGGASWSEALGAFGLWLALGWSVARASARGLVAKEGAFLRTPKVRGELGWRDALRGNRIESLAALVCAGVAAVTVAQGTPAAAVVGLLLLGQGLGFAAAPLNSLAAIRAELPAELRRRRRQSLLSWTRLGSTPRRLVLTPVVGLAVLGLAFVVLAAPVGTPLPGRLPGLARGDHAGGSHQAPVTSGRPAHSRAPAPTSTLPPAPAPAPPTTATRVPATQAPGPAATAPAPTRTSSPTARPTRAATPTQAASPTSPAPAPGKPTGKPTQAASPTKAVGKPTDRPSHGSSAKP